MIALECYNCGLFWIQPGNELTCQRCNSDIVEIVDNNYDGLLQPGPIAEIVQYPVVPEIAPNLPEVVPNMPPNIPEVPQLPINVVSRRHRCNCNACGGNTVPPVQSIIIQPPPVPILPINMLQIAEAFRSSSANLAPAPNPIIPRQPHNVDRTNMTLRSSSQNPSQNAVSAVSSGNSSGRRRNITMQRVNGNVLISMNGGNQGPNATATNNNQPTNSGASTSTANQDLRRTTSRRRSRSAPEGPVEKRSRSRSMTNSELGKIEKITKTKLKEGEDECGICYESFDGRKVIRRLKCQHSYHQTCIFGWLKKDSTCPFCRYNLVDDDENAGRQT